MENLRITYLHQKNIRSTTYICNCSYVLISSIMEVCSSSRKFNLVTFDNHPVLIRLFTCEVGVRYICFPHHISAFGPLDRDLQPSRIGNTYNFKLVHSIHMAKTILPYKLATIKYFWNTLPCNLVEEESSNWSAFLELGSAFHSAPSKTNPASILSGI